MTTGIDISSNNPGFTQIDTNGVSFCVVKASQGANYQNPLRFAQAAWARSRGLQVGVYHWVSPTVDPAAQAANFRHAIGGMGSFFMWALDCEEPYPASDNQWGQVVVAMLQQCAASLGDRGSVYVGRYFHAPTLVPIAQQHRWWLPDYTGNPLPVVPFIHQYTSAGGLDRNLVTNDATYQQLVGQPLPAPAPKEIDNVFVYSNSHSTGYLVTDPGKTPLANNAEYQALVKAGVRDAGRLGDAFDVGLPLAVKV